MSTSNRFGAKVTDTAAWMYGCLSLSMVALGLAAQSVYATVTSSGWQISQGIPVNYFVLAFASLGFVGLAKLGRPTHAPTVTAGALLGLLAIVVAVLSFDFGALVLDPPFWVALVGGIITFISLFVGWRSDASEKKLKAEIAELKAKIQVKDEVIDALKGKFPSPTAVAVVIATAISVGLFNVATNLFNKRDGGQR